MPNWQIRFLRAVEAPVPEAACSLRQRRLQPSLPASAATRYHTSGSLGSAVSLSFAALVESASGQAVGASRGPPPRRAGLLETGPHHRFRAGRADARAIEIGRAPLGIQRARRARTALLREHATAAAGSRGTPRPRSSSTPRL